MRLIDADALKYVYERHFLYSTGSEQPPLIRDLMRFFTNSCIELLDNAPTIDAVKVVHAKWIVQDAGITHFMCSSCNAPNYPLRFNYCPNCGAKMNEEREEF